MKYRHSTVERTAPTGSPVSVLELADQLRLDIPTGEDTLLSAYLDTATLYVRDYTSRSIQPQQWTRIISPIEEPIRLARDYSIARERILLMYPPVTDILDVYRVRVDGTILDDLDYKADLTQTPAEIWLNAWPGFETQIRIDYLAGYGEYEDLPAPIKQAIIQMAAYLYEHRGDCDAAGLVMQSGAAALLAPYRVVMR
jgi:uncharacterized phiE125 gp8 family phage protein